MRGGGRGPDDEPRRAVVVDVETVESAANPAPSGPEDEAHNDGRQKLAAPPHHEIVVLGWAELRDFFTLRLCCYTHPLEGLVRLAAALRVPGAEAVTFGGTGFDLPVIAWWCLAYGIPLPAWFGSRVLRAGPRTRHVDLCAELSDAGAARRPRLHSVVAPLGLPGKRGMTGADVGRAVAEGRLADVERYNLEDVAQETALFVRRSYVAGLMTPARYHGAIDAWWKCVSKEPRLEEFRAGVALDKLKDVRELPRDPRFDVPPCPQCQAAMVLRSPRNRAPFWGCSRYPQCRTQVAIRSAKT